jgi:hypothetical protein
VSGQLDVGGTCNGSPMAVDVTINNLLNGQLADETIEETVREVELGPLGFGAAKPMLRTIKEILSSVLAVSEEDIPVSVANTLAQNINTLDQTLSRMRSFDIGISNPKDGRDGLVQEVGRFRDYLVQEIRPLVRVDESKLLALQSELAKTLEETRAATAASTAATADVRGSVLETSAEKLSQFYSGQAKDHQDSAARFQLAAIVGGAAAAIAIVGLFLVWPPRTSTHGRTDLDVTLFIRESFLRLLLLGLVFIGLNFCLRNYRVNKHLQTLNEARANALETVGPLSRGAISSDAGREIVIHELVSAVFAIGDTGYVASNGDHTIVESSNSLAALLGALKS